MDKVLVRELPIKSTIRQSDYFVAEDDDGTKLVQFKDMINLTKSNLYAQSVEDMKNTTYQEGDIVETLGYYEPNDGGAAKYLIVYAPTDLQDGVLIHYLKTSDTLRAHLMHDGNISVLQGGVRGNGVVDDTKALTKVLSLPYNITIPPKTYKVTSPISIKSDKVVNLNNATIINETSACIEIGYDEPVSNVCIKNGILKGTTGIEIHKNANNINIEDCIFKSSNLEDVAGIVVNGEGKIMISNCLFTDLDNYGIEIGPSGSDQSITKSNIVINHVNISAKNTCIRLSNVTGKRSVIISNSVLSGVGSTCIGIYMMSDKDTVSISNCNLLGLNKGIAVAGLVDVVSNIDDIICEDTDILYDFASSDAKIQLTGLHRMIAKDATTCYLFDAMASKLYSSAEFDLLATSPAKINSNKQAPIGSLVDYKDIGALNPIVITALTQLEDSSIVPGYKNIVLSVEVSGTISRIGHSSINGQVLYLYSPNGAIVSSQNIDVGSNVTLNKYTPLILKNKNGKWTRIG